MPVYAIEAAILVAATVVKMVLYGTLFFNAVKQNKYQSEGGKSGYGEYPCSLYFQLLGVPMYTNACTNDQ